MLLSCVQICNTSGREASPKEKRNMFDTKCCTCTWDPYLSINNHIKGIYGVATYAYSCTSSLLQAVLPCSTQFGPKQLDKRPSHVRHILHNCYHTVHKRRLKLQKHERQHKPETLRFKLPQREAMRLHVLVASCGRHTCQIPRPAVRLLIWRDTRHVAHDTQSRLGLYVFTRRHLSEKNKAETWQLVGRISFQLYISYQLNWCVSSENSSRFN